MIRRRPGPSRRRPKDRARRLASLAGLWVAAAVVALVVAWALWPQLFSAASPLAIAPEARFEAPSLAHPFGTDNLGRDTYARTVHGASVSLRAVLTAVAIGFLTGSALGLIAGYAGGWLDNVLMRAADVAMSIPSLLLSLLVITALGFGTMSVAVAVGISAIASFMRVMRAEVIKKKTAPYLQAARASGVRTPRLLVEYMLPNASSSAVGMAGLEFGSALLSVASLGFLGFGVTPPDPEWGSLVAEGRNYLATAWWMSTMPGLVVVIVVVSANALGRRAHRRATL